MGRKSLGKPRKIDEKKRRSWIIKLYPYLRDNGLKGLKMNKVAGVLELSKSTVYEYFKSKEEIIEETLNYQMEKLMKFSLILDNKEKSLKDRYVELMGYMSPVLSDISELIMEDLKYHYPKLWLRVETFFDFAQKELMKYYEEGIKKNEFKRMNPIILARQDYLFFTQLLEPTFLKENDLKPMQVFEEYFSLKFYGLLYENKP